MSGTCQHCGQIVPYGHNYNCYHQEDIAFMTDNVFDPHKIASEYERLKTIMPHYPSEGELMRMAIRFVTEQMVT